MRDYLTLSDAQSRTEVSRSKFIGYIFRLNAQGDAQNFLQTLKKQHSSANHICYAFNEDIHEGYRFSDDGEPSKTAGYPIMEQLSRNSYKMVLAAVVRYFGGVKLGTGGLARAYSECVQEALKNATPIKMQYVKLMSLTLDYTLFASNKATLENAKIKILDTAYADTVTLKLAVNNEEEANALISTLFAGKARLIPIGEDYIEVIQ